MNKTNELTGRPVRKLEDAIPLFWKKVKKGNGCWEWQGYINPSGYGTFWFRSESGIIKLAHRFSYFLEHGMNKVTSGFICHHCDNKKCVRPDHLYLGDAKTNARDAVERKLNPHSRKTHCKYGHEFTPENTAFLKGKIGRHCRKCQQRRNDQRPKLTNRRWKSTDLRMREMN